MADDIIAVLDFDGSPALATIDEIIAALEQLSQAASQVGDAAGGMSSLDDILSAIQANTEATAAGFDQLDASLSGIADLADISASALQNLDAAFGEMAASASAGAGEATGSLEELDVEMRTKAEDSASMMDALNAAQGPLMMIAGAALMAGGAFVKMGSDGQAGEALLKGMAGASQDDINALEADAQKLGVGMKEASAGFYMVESAGYSGADGLKVFDAAERLTLGGQANAQDVMTGTTAIMHDYGISASHAGDVTDKMAMAVFKGKQSMQDFATSVGTLAAAGHKAGFGLDEVLAAESTMTMINPHVRQDTMQLGALFDSLDPKMGKVEKTAKGLGLSFNDAHYKSLDLLGKLQYLAQIAGGVTTPAFAKLTGGVRGATAASDLMMGKSSTFKDDLNAQAHAAGRAEYSFQQWENTIPSALGHVGASLSIFATKLMDAIGPAVVPIIKNVADAIGHMADYLTTHMDVLIPVLAGLAAVIGGVLVAAVISFVVAAGPIILILLAIGAVVGGVVYAFMHWGQIMKSVASSPLAPMLRAIVPIFHMIVSALQSMVAFLISTFKPVWAQLVYSFNDIKAAIQPIMPQLQYVAQVIGITIVGAVILAIAIIAGLIRVLAAVLIGVAKFVTGVIQFFSGLVQAISGIIQLLSDLFTGKFNKIGADLDAIMQGIFQMFLGVWNMIAALWQVSIGAIQGFAEGFVQAIINIFQNLANTLVGHSIIPDMINSIVQWFARLPSRALSAVQGLLGMMASFFGNLASQALSWGANIINNLAAGIKSAIGAVKGAISSVVSTIAGFLPHSPAKEGELSHLNEYGPALVQGFADGITANVSKIRQAMQGLTSQVAVGLAPAGAVQGPSPLAPGGSVAPLGGSSALPLLAGILQAIQQQSNKPQGPQTPPTSTMYNNMSLYGVTNIQDLYNSLNSLQGYSYENGLRGAL